MAYEKTTWQNGVTKVNASNMNNIEQGIYNNSLNIGDLTNLKTEVKSNLVNAINELKDKDAYSTTEQRIGTWIDGKPLYRRILTGTLPTGSGNNSFTFNGIYITDYRGNVKSRYSQWWPLHNYYASDTSYNISSYLSENRNEISIDCGSHFTTSSQYEITIEYTKTSD